MSHATHPLTFIDPVCGKPGWHADSVPLPTDPILAHRAEHLDGSAVQSSDLVACESCWRVVWPGDGELVDPANYVPRSA